MSKNGWIACIIVVIVLLCACVFCLMVSLIGRCKLYPSLPYSQSELTPTVEVGSPTSSPIVIRPTPQRLKSTPTSPSIPATPQIEIATPVPESTSSPVVGADGYHSHSGKHVYSDQ